MSWVTALIFLSIYVALTGLLHHADLNDSTKQTTDNRIVMDNKYVDSNRQDHGDLRMKNAYDVEERSKTYIDDGREEHGDFIYNYKGKYSNATTGKALRMSSMLRRHFGWHNLQLEKMSLEVVANFVVVTAASDRFARHMESIVGSVQKFLPNRTVIVYDIGMTENQVSAVSFCLTNLPQDKMAAVSQTIFSNAFS